MFTLWGSMFTLWGPRSPCGVHGHPGGVHVHLVGSIFTLWGPCSPCEVHVHLVGLWSPCRIHVHPGGPCSSCRGSMFTLWGFMFTLSGSMFTPWGPCLPWGVQYEIFSIFLSNKTKIISFFLFFSLPFIFLSWKETVASFCLSKRVVLSNYNFFFINLL